MLKLVLFITTFIISITAFANETIQSKLASLEASSGGRLGISAIDTSNNMSIQYHADERFPFCSTSKIMSVSAILKQNMIENNLLEQKITYTKKDTDLSGYAPITKNHIASGMTIGELCAAAIIQSDNAAMNLLMKKLGGSQVVTSFARSIDDNVFRLDRWEPELNSAIPGDLRDTTTSNAMEKSFQKLVLGGVLAKPQRELLINWLKNNTTGEKRIRAGVPKGLIVGDKTGAGSYGTTNDIAIIWPPKCAPIVVAIYYTNDKNKNAPKREDVLASATRILLNEFAQADQCIKL
jgi:beta-lactamase class A